MTRRRAVITEAELNRMLRVARKHGAVAVEVKTSEAEFRILLAASPNSRDEKTTKVAKRELIRLG